MWRYCAEWSDATTSWYSCGMRITITRRIFLALTIVSLLILALNAMVTRWSFQRGFLDYVAQQEAATVESAAASLAEFYRDAGGWEPLRHNPRKWNDLLRPDEARPGPGRSPGPGGHPPPQPDPLGLTRRLTLVDAEGVQIIGPPAETQPTRSVPIVVDEITVGFISVAPRRQLSNPLDQSFASDQERSIYLIAATALLIAATISAVLARQLTRPLLALAVATRSITAGDYHTRIADDRGDELGDLARDLNQLTETLDKHRSARRQWVANIAHELRTPLAILRGELDAIDDGIRTFDAATQKSLQAEVARLTSLVVDLHDLSIYDEGGTDFQRESTDIGQILSTVLNNSRNRLRDAGIELRISIADQPLPVLGSRTRLEQLFTNLVENTIRYTDAPGTLSVSCRQHGSSIEVGFSDSPPSVPPNSQAHLFERLYRVDASRNRDSGGSGLGLSICKSIVETHGGAIEAVDSPTGGLTIRMRLPLEKNVETG